MLVLGGKGVAVPAVRLEQAHSMAVELAVVVAHGYSVYAIQLVVDSAV